MTTTAAVVSRVRTELGDYPRSFVDSFLGDGTTKRFVRPFAPLLGSSVVVHDGATDLTSTVTVEEPEGVLNFATAPTAGHTISVSGTHYRYFTDAELTTIVNEAFLQHTARRVDAFGRGITIANLDPVEEYPLALLATVNALWTLATDSSFDIDILAPDGVTIPRSQRYRQLMEMVNERRAQYQGLCSALNIGLDRIEVFTLRRISHRTNRYVAIYRPQEVDDSSMPQRVFLPLPTYGADTPPDSVPTQDLIIYQGDTFTLPVTIPGFDGTNYVGKAQIRPYPGAPVALAEFTVVAVTPATGSYTLSLIPDQTVQLPVNAYWDFQFTNASVATDIQTKLHGHVFTTRQVTTSGGVTFGSSGIPNPPLLWGSADTGFTQTPPPGAGGFV